ncbi:hypothetical protein L1887_47954 [Cichorium endivia]|nr:hypothetical protein L1887_47954 [Cichorium endivia]
MYDGGARRWRDRAQGQAGNRARDAGACFTMSCCWLDVIDAPRLNAAALVLTAGGLRANLGIALLGRRKNNLAVGNRQIERRPAYTAETPYLKKARLASAFLTARRQTAKRRDKGVLSTDHDASAHAGTSRDRSTCELALTTRTDVHAKFIDLEWQQRNRLLAGAQASSNPDQPSQWARLTGEAVAARNRYVNVEPFAQNRLTRIEDDEPTRTQIRQLQLRTETGNSALPPQEQEIYHLLFSGWPDFLVPEGDDRAALTRLIQLSAQLNSKPSDPSATHTNGAAAADFADSEQDNPRIIHCSAGVGRSAAYDDGAGRGAVPFCLRDAEGGFHPAGQWRVSGCYWRTTLEQGSTLACDRRRDVHDHEDADQEIVNAFLTFSLAA